MTKADERLSFRAYAAAALIAIEHTIGKDNVLDKTLDEVRAETASSVAAQLILQERGFFKDPIGYENGI